ncbi:Methyl sulfide methyltransferase-associated sensor [uncultured archaeon]|nr:Methyl sulfide methyltransferase-associated sensor [uncultured archaeon]
MKNELRILILEDDKADAELIEHELRKANIIFRSQRVQTRDAFRKKLFDFEPDLILADYTLPAFDGSSALRMVKEKNPDVPFIFVSGTIGEDFAIESLKSGATDYVLKDRLSRLVPAVDRALSEAKEKIEYRKARKALEESELRFRSVVESANDAIILTDGKNDIISWNNGAATIFGYLEEEVLGKSLQHIMPWQDENEKKMLYSALSDKSGIIGKTIETYGLRKDDSKIPLEISIATWNTGDQTFYSVIMRDITERKKAEDLLKENARAELYGFIVSALPVFARGVPSQVRNNLVKNFAERFENNIRPRFQEEMKRLGYGQKVECNSIEDTHKILEIYLSWLAGLFSSFGVQVRKKFHNANSSLELLNCPWRCEARGNPIFCLICRTIVMRSFIWTSFKGSANQNSSIADGSKICVFEIHVKSGEI